MTDPTTTLESKLNDFAATLTPDELTVLHEVFHLAAEGSEVHGFTVPLNKSSQVWGDPCEGGEVTFPGTFQMLGNLHVSLHDISISKRYDKSSPKLG